MSAADALSPWSLYLAARNLAVDRLTGEAVGWFEAERIPCVLFKGPVIQQALYPDLVRIYGDSDLLVPAADWDRAVALLERRGFTDYLRPLAHPRMESLAGTAFIRGSDNLDLHATLEGIEAPPEVVWQVFTEHGGRLLVGGREVAVPPPATVLMQLALHAAKHPAEPKPAEDLRRGVEQMGVEQWRRAADVAERLGGLAMFAEALRRTEPGRALAEALGVSEVRSVHADLRAAQVPLAEGLNELLSPGLGSAERLRRARSELFPNPSFMRWHSDLAGRGRLGLALSYPQRWWFLARRLTPAVAEVRRARARRDR